MALKICLLVSDDFDDHQAIAEALAGISEKAVLLNVLDSQKALLLLKDAECRPDYLILDLSMHGMKINSILKVVREGSVKPASPVILLGKEEAFLQIDNHADLVFLDEDYTYSELAAFLGRVLRR